MTKSLFGLLLVTLALSGCFTNGRQLHNGEKWIPATFNPRKTTLLVLYFNDDQRNGTTKGMEVYMKTHYPHPYEFVSEETLKSGKYADSTQYRFALIWSRKTTALRDTRTGRNNGAAIGFDLHFYDFVRDKHYAPTGNSNTFTSMTYKPAINTLEKKYGGKKKK